MKSQVEFFESHSYKAKGFQVEEALLKEEDRA